jgi:hypothetical protein
MDWLLSWKLIPGCLWSEGVVWFLSVRGHIFWSAEIIYRRTGSWMRIIRVEGSDHDPNKDSVWEYVWLDTANDDNFNGPKIQHTVIRKVLMSDLHWQHRMYEMDDATHFRRHNLKRSLVTYDFKETLNTQNCNTSDIQCGLLKLPNRGERLKSTNLIMSTTGVYNREYCGRELSSICLYSS